MRHEKSRKLSRVALLLTLVLVAALALSGCGKNTKPQVEIEIEDYGTIKLELDRKAAPITVENFLKLVEEDFYDGLTFHRIVSGFMIQGGDPEGTGMGGSDETIKGEFSANGVENSLSHTRGAISMARSSAMDSASSQFFIVQEDSTFLDGEYAAFGYVTEGIEIVDQIVEEVLQYPFADEGMNLVATEHQPVIKSITVVK
ncbi:MAG: peptidylprolyl isomerase [Lachnospiraceae bacterium]|jgi:peptidyl-prolyl cis-trans isomerase B (cyclophilin B)|nr:peptidylprolyl isomerase [Lachnospiraceae bacterium]